MLLRLTLRASSMAMPPEESRHADDEDSKHEHVPLPLRTCRSLGEPRSAFLRRYEGRMLRIEP